MWQKCPRQKHLGFDIRDQSEFVEQMALSVFVLFFLIVLFPEQGFMCFVSGARIKCRSCRLDRCLQQGMRKEGIFIIFFSNLFYLKIMRT